MRFTKMHALGNDFICVNCFEEDLIVDPGRLAELVSDRHFGIGADGLLLIAPSETADFRMAVYNPDGSRADMDGNGLRCLAKYVYDHGLTNMTTITVETISGVRFVDMTVKDDKVRLASVDMGIPVLETNDAGKELHPTVSPWITESELSETIMLGERELRLTLINTGVLHAVAYVSDVEAVPLTVLGPRIETHQRFPNRTSVDFVQVIDKEHIRIRVWERGVGETMACGTGACASVVAANLAGFTRKQVDVRLPGGTLNVSIGENGHMIMVGPATEVFSGDFDV